MGRVGENADKKEIERPEKKRGTETVKGFFPYVFSAAVYMSIQQPNVHMYL